MKTFNLIVICAIIVSTKEDALSSELGAWVRSIFNKKGQVIEKTELTTLRYTKYAQSDYMALYRNLREVGIESQPFYRTPKIMERPNPSKQPALILENRIKAHEEFKSMCLYFKRILEVDIREYNQFNGYLDEGPSVSLRDDFNLRIFIYKKKSYSLPDFTKRALIQSDNIHNIRLFVSKEYYFNPAEKKLRARPSRVFPGPRMGLCYYDKEVLIRYEKVTNPTNTKPVIDRLSNMNKNSSNERFPFKYRIIEALFTREVFILIEFINNEKSAEAKLELHKEQTSLALSKRLLNKLGNIGYHNKGSGCYFDFNLAKINSDNFRNYFTFSVTYIKKLRAFRSSIKKEVNKHLNDVRRNCTRVRNMILKRDSFGQRVPSKDKENSTSALRAFVKDSVVRYVYSYKEKAFFGKDDILTFARKQLKTEFTCVYHDDDYMVDIELNEMYLITFIPNNQNDVRKRNTNLLPYSARQNIAKPVHGTISGKENKLNRQEKPYLDFNNGRAKQLDRSVIETGKEDKSYLNNQQVEEMDQLVDKNDGDTAHDNKSMNIAARDIPNENDQVYYPNEIDTSSYNLESQDRDFIDLNRQQQAESLDEEEIEQNELEDSEELQNNINPTEESHVDEDIENYEDILSKNKEELSDNVVKRPVNAKEVDINNTQSWENTIDDQTAVRYPGYHRNYTLTAGYSCTARNYDTGIDPYHTYQALNYLVAAADIVEVAAACW